MRRPPLLVAVFAAAVAALAGACDDAAAPDDPSPDDASAEEPAPDDASAEAPAADGEGSDADATSDEVAPSDGASFHASLGHLDRGTVVLERAEDGERIEAAVTLPRTREEFRRGLMEVPQLEEGTGMLFDFGEPREGGFWMKDTLVALDIAFAGADGEVLAVLAMEPCDAEPCPTYDPAVAYRYALEVPQGWFDANDLGPGDHLEVVEDPSAS